MSRRVVASLLTASVLGLSACAHRPKAPKPLSEVKSIAVVQPLAPSRLTLVNANALAFVLPFGGVFSFVAGELKTRTFNEQMTLTREALPSVLAVAVADSLRKRGYRVDIVSNAPRKADDPDELDRAKLDVKTDAVLDLKLAEVGLYSGQVSVDYLPRVQIRGVLFLAGQESDIDDEAISWGVDAEAGNESTLESAEFIAWRSFDDLLSNLQAVRNAFDAGVVASGERLTSRIDSALR